MKTVMVSAPGKIIIAGEYAVLADAPAISMAIDKRARVSIREHDKKTHVLKTSGFINKELLFIVNNNGEIEWLSGTPDNPVRIFFECMWQQVNICPSIYYEFIFDTAGFYDEEAKLKYGIGSSAALMVALAGAFIEIFKLSLGAKELALKAHRDFQGANGSGVDIATSMEGGIIKYFRKENKVPVSLEFPCDLKFRIFWSGTPVSTPEQLKKIKRFSKKSFLDLKTTAVRFASNWNQNNQLFLKYLDEYTDALMEFSKEYDLNIFGHKHNILVGLAKKKNNLVYKPCGAGGDIGICIASSVELLDDFEKSANHSGFVSLNLQLDKVGLTLGS